MQIGYGGRESRQLYRSVSSRRIDEDLVPVDAHVRYDAYLSTCARNLPVRSAMTVCGLPTGIPMFSITVCQRPCLSFTCRAGSDSAFASL